MNKEQISQSVVDRKSARHSKLFDSKELKKIFRVFDDKRCLTFGPEENRLENIIDFSVDITMKMKEYIRFIKIETENKPSQTEEEIAHSNIYSH